MEMLKDTIEDFGGRVVKEAEQKKAKKKREPERQENKILEELNVNMLSCGECANCSYHEKCREYSDYVKFIMGVGKRCDENEGA